MGIFDGCLLATDIDGTLMTSGYINPKNIEKIEFFMNEGGCFSLSTGRAAVAINDVLAKLKNISPSVVLNGCIIYDCNESAVIYENVLPRKDYEIVNAVISSGVNVGIEIHSRKNVYTLKRTKNVDLHQVYEKFTSPDVTFEEASQYTWNKVLYIFDNAEDREKIKELLSKEKTDSAFIDTCAVINGEFQNYHEQIPKGVSKALAIDKLCEILNIKEGKVFAIGDYYNDVEMLKKADISAVPFDSPEVVKEIAEYITVGCKDGAVADFIDYLTSKFSAVSRI